MLNRMIKSPLLLKLPGLGIPSPDTFRSYLGCITSGHAMYTVRPPIVGTVK